MVWQRSGLQGGPLWDEGKGWRGGGGREVGLLKAQRRFQEKSGFQFAFLSWPPCVELPQMSPDLLQHLSPQLRLFLLRLCVSLLPVFPFSNVFLGIFPIFSSCCAVPSLCPSAATFTSFTRSPFPMQKGDIISCAALCNLALCNDCCSTRQLLRPVMCQLCLIFTISASCIISDLFSRHFMQKLCTHMEHDLHLHVLYSITQDRTLQCTLFMFHCPVCLTYMNQCCSYRLFILSIKLPTVFLINCYVKIFARAQNDILKCLFVKLDGKQYGDVYTFLPRTDLFVSLFGKKNKNNTIHTLRTLSVAVVHQGTSLDRLPSDLCVFL